MAMAMVMMTVTMMMMMLMMMIMIMMTMIMRMISRRIVQKKCIAVYVKMGAVYYTCIYTKIIWYPSWLSARRVFVMMTSYFVQSRSVGLFTICKDDDVYCWGFQSIKVRLVFMPTELSLSVLSYRYSCFCIIQSRKWFSVHRISHVRHHYWIENMTWSPFN